MGLTETQIEIAKKMAVKALAKQFVKKLATHAAFFAVPGVGQAAEFFVGIGFNFMIEWTMLKGELVVIWAANKAEVEKAVKTRDDLKEKQKRKEDTTAAERAFNEASDNLVKLRVGKL